MMVLLGNFVSDFLISLPKDFLVFTPTAVSHKQEVLEKMSKKDLCPKK